ncbi:dehydrogenase [Amycolatopsis antarctica]|uniref:Dehydrogenase n=1 Tax=Amycolatopsis antarctica TaxID=1854586 RepID=A0A263D4D1_9PSEU|nr:YciI family protein [Amycolatopsis antarctica]OZM73310.1 dehydrogenase [Amycolatopsis antarctica]
MRFMMIVKADAESEAGAPPAPDALADMAAYNEDLVRAGVLLAADGLRPSRRGARVSTRDGRRTVTEGPFPEPETLVAGYWVIQAAAKDEAVAWALRCPAPEVEIRQVFEAAELHATS